MATLRETLTIVKQMGDLFAGEVDAAGYSKYAFEPDNSPSDFAFLSTDAEMAREELIAAAERVLLLARGPQGSLGEYRQTGLVMGTVHSLIEMGIPELIPLGQAIHFEKLARGAKMAVELLRRLVSLASASGFLRRDGDYVRHSAMSACLVQDVYTADATRFMLGVDMRANAYVAASVVRDPTGQTPESAPFALSLQASGPKPTTYWDFLEQNPIECRRFRQIMEKLSAAPTRSVAAVPMAFDWTQVNTVVDVGGSGGHAALAITEQYKHLQIIVQDLDEVLKQRPLLTSNDGSRISFMAHDFHLPQPIVADAYLLRFVLHDWPDRVCQDIIRNLLPALRPGARVMVMELTLPEPGTLPGWLEKIMYINDIAMFALCSGQERSVRQLRSLIETCEPRLEFEAATTPPESHSTLLSWIMR